MLNSIRINHARIKFRDHVATVMYERVKGSDLINEYITPSRTKPNITPKPIYEAFHGKCDTLERDIFIGGLFSFSPIVIFVI